MRPTIAVPLTNVRAEEGKTVNFNCSVIATTMSGWTLFTWLKNNDTIRSNPKKYSNITEITPDESGNFIQSFLTIYNISKEDEGNYTFIVYYDPSVLKEFGINDKICNLTTAALLVKLHNKCALCLMLVCVCVCTRMCACVTQCVYKYVGTFYYLDSHLCH